MSSVGRLFGAFGGSDGRIRLMTSMGVAGLVAALAIFIVLPASAGSGEPSGSGVQPTEVIFGGGPGACAVFSDAALELHINNPMDGTYTGPDGTQVMLDVTADDFYFDFTFVNNPTMYALDVVVNGGANNTHFDYDGSTGAVRSDTDLHAPTKGGSTKLYNLSHVNLCYDVLPVADVSGVKYHDHDTDGDLDPTEESGLAGWTITAFDDGDNVAGSAETDADGLYTIADLAPGDYTICEATNSSGLPDNGDGFTWGWTQSEPSSGVSCPAGYLPWGHTVTIGASGNVTDIDFGNHRQVGIDCSEGDVTLVLGGGGTDDDPIATVVVPQDSPSCSGENAPWTVTFDVGRSEDSDETEDDFSQFVVFGDGEVPNPDTTITVEIVWDAEPANYDENNNLVVETTQVSFPDLADIGSLTDVTRCNTSPGLPDPVTPVCLDSRTIEEGGDLGTDIQVTENYVILGDPGYFR